MTRFMLDVVIAFLFALFLITVVFGQESKDFPLDTPLYDKAAVCLLEADAVDIINAEMKGRDALMATIHEKSVNMKCGLVQEVIVYKRLRLRLLDKDGVRLSVYEAVINGVKVFVPMKGWGQPTI